MHPRIKADRHGVVFFRLFSSGDADRGLSRHRMRARHPATLRMIGNQSEAEWDQFFSTAPASPEPSQLVGLGARRGIVEPECAE